VGIQRITLIAICLLNQYITDQFRNLIVNGTTTGDWVYNRMTANVSQFSFMLARLLINFTVQHVDSGPMTDVSSQAVRCYEASDSVAANTSVATVAAGSTVGFKVR